MFVCPGTVLMLAVLARQSHKARLLILGNPIANRRQPVRVAEEMAMIDVLSRGRLEAGFVRGVPYEISPANSNPTRMHEREFEALDMIVKAWTNHDGPVSFDKPLHAADAPGIAVPEALTLPVTAIRLFSDIGRTIGRAVIAGCVAGPVVGAGTIIIGARRNRAADDGAADNSAGDGRAKGALGVSGGRGGENQGADGGQCHQNFPHGITFLMNDGATLSKRSVCEKFHTPLE